MCYKVVENVGVGEVCWNVVESVEVGEVCWNVRKAFKLSKWSLEWCCNTHQLFNISTSSCVLLNSRKNSDL